ncbi:uncharacterized protein [Montipora capricornis]|uniref:uncharacterized protein isoform X2 n=1 Tax=Montipora capricornis TaxID=246305 RepID=UPI0035F17DBD
MEESIVKEFLIGAGYNQQAVRKYKTLRAWEHKEGIHSVKIHLLPNHKDVWAVRGSCNPSFSTDNEESKVMYLVLESSTNKPVYSYCTCTAGLRGDCSHIGALMFVLSDIVAEGKELLPSDATCTDLPYSWSDPKGAKVEPVLVENIIKLLQS